MDNPEGDTIRYIESVTGTLHEPFLVLTEDLRVRSANAAFLARFGLREDEIKGRLVYEIGGGLLDLPAMRAMLEAELPKKEFVRGLEIENVPVDGSVRRIVVNARRLAGPGLVLLGIRDDDLYGSTCGASSRAAGDRFRVLLTEAIRPLTDPIEIQAEATRVLGRHVNASRVLYGEVDETETFVTIERDYTDGVMNLRGRLRMADFSEAYVDGLRAGRTIVVPNIHRDPRLTESGRAAFESIELQALLAVPLVKEGRFVAVLTVNQNEPRDWTLDEVVFMEEVAETTWAAVERARAEASLQASESRYRAIFHAAGISIWDEDFSEVKAALDELESLGVTDIEPYLKEHPEFVERMLGLVRIHDVNDTTLRMYGAKDKQELTDSLSRIFLPEAMPIFRRELLTIARGDTSFVSEVPMQTLAGERMETAFTFTVADPPVCSHVLVCLLDITERVRAEQALRESEERYRTYLRNSPIVFSFVDTDLRYQWMFSPGPTFDSGRMIGKRADEVEHGAGIETLVTLMRLAMRQQEQLRKEVTFERTTGERTFDVTATPVFDAGGDVEGVVTASLDVTDRKRVEIALRELNETLEQRVAERTEQVRNLAKAITEAEQEERRRISQILHDDLQQNLYGLGMILGMIRKANSEESASRLREQADEVLRQATRLTQTLSTQLNPPVLNNPDLKDALEWVAARKKDLYGLNVNVDVRGRIDISEFSVRVLLQQTIRELLFNVVKHSGVENARLIAHAVADEVVIRIEDDGKGFDADEVAARKSARGGLGLASIRERIALAGGRFAIDGSPGRGTRVTLTLPLREKAPETA